MLSRWNPPHISNCCSFTFMRQLDRIFTQKQWFSTLQGCQERFEMEERIIRYYFLDWIGGPAEISNFLECQLSNNSDCKFWVNIRIKKDNLELLIPSSSIDIFSIILKIVIFEQYSGSQLISALGFLFSFQQQYDRII